MWQLPVDLRAATCQWIRHLAMYLLLTNIGIVISCSYFSWGLRVLCFQGYHVSYPVLRIQDPVLFYPCICIRDGFFGIRDPIHRVLRASTKSLGYLKSLSFDSNLFLYRYLLKNLIIFNFLQFMTPKKVTQLLYFFPLFVIVGSGNGIENNQGPGSGINIPDSQHCSYPGHHISCLCR
jgi:hypothetical protein